MKLTEFLKTEKIPFYKIWYYIDDKTCTKKPIGEKNNDTIEDINKKSTRTISKPKSIKKKNKDGWVDIPLSTTELETLQESYTLFLKHTDNYYCVDIDDRLIGSMEEFILQTKCDIFKNCPWVVGNTKGIHIYIKINDMVPYSDQLQVYNDFNGDLIKTNNMWEKTTKQIYNYNNEVPSFNFKDIKHIFNDKITSGLKTTKPKKDSKKISKLNNEINILGNNNMINQTNNLDNQKNKDIETLIECLSVNRSNDYSDWTKIGMILKNEGCDSSMFHKFSKKSSKYDESETESKYDSFKNAGLTIATLHYYAKIDNQEKYYKDVVKIYNVNLYTPLFTSSLIAEYFKLLYNDKFIFSNGNLYFFNGVYWKTDDIKMSHLHLFVNNEFCKTLIKYTTIKITEINENIKTTVEEKQQQTQKVTDLLFNINTIREGRKRKTIIDDILIWITNNDIEFDVNPYLFAFENKIYDLEKGDFVKPNPKDYISITTGYEYTEFENLETSKENLMDLINKILPEQEVRDFYLTVLSTGLCGLQMQNLIIATGIGGNGKSVLDSLMLKSTGNYGYKIPNTILLSPIKEGANPQVYCINNKRFCLAQEPDNKKKICCSTVKELTGDNTINVRDNYSSKCGISLKLSLLMECNDLPLLDETTAAMMRRIIAIPFNSKFVSEKDYNDETDKTNIFIADPYLTTDKFQNENKQILFEILKEYFKVFKNNNNKLPEMPEECKKLTMNYLAISDNIYEWFIDSFEQDEASIVSLKDVYEVFHDSEFYSNLSKQDKRLYNNKYFNEKLEKNIFLRKCIKQRKETYKGNQLSSVSVVGWRKKVPELVVITNY